MGMIENLQAMLASGQDNALLRFTLGSQLLKAGDVEQALPHLAAAVCDRIIRVFSRRHNTPRISHQRPW